MQQTIKFTLTTLITDDLPRARDFYETLLQQEATIDSEVHVMYAGGFSLWDRKMAESLVLKKKEEMSGRKNQAECFSHELCFECAELEEMQERMHKAGVDFVHDLTEQPWGQMVLRVRDPDGRILEIGESLHDTVKRIYLESGNDKSETSRRTHIPLEALDSYLP